MEPTKLLSICKLGLEIALFVKLKHFKCISQMEISLYAIFAYIYIKRYSIAHK